MPPELLVVRLLLPILKPALFPSAGMPRRRTSAQ